MSFLRFRKKELPEATPAELEYAAERARQFRVARDRNRKLMEGVIAYVLAAAGFHQARVDILSDSGQPLTGIAGFCLTLDDKGDAIRITTIGYSEKDVPKWLQGYRAALRRAFSAVLGTDGLRYVSETTYEPSAVLIFDPPDVVVQQLHQQLR